jgi:hypothetical protein
MALGHGGITAVAAACGISRGVIHAGIRELHDLGAVKRMAGRVRRPGGGRKKLTEKDPGLLPALERLVEPTTRGDPESPLRWTCKSTRRLARELTARKHRVGPTKVAALLREMGYSLQANRKTREGTRHPDRDAQFRQINRRVKSFQNHGQPVISVDTKKKELVGDFKNGGREWRPKGKPEKVRVHDFRDKKLGKVIPYGVYDVTHNEGWVSVGVDHDTAEFAVEAVYKWWRRMGRSRFPRARELMITADCGGSNGNRSRLWKVALQRLADRTGLARERLSLSPGDEQVEQDRAPALLPYHPELARQTSDEPRGHRETHRRHYHRGGTPRESRAGQEAIPDRGQSRRRRARAGPSSAGSLPWRLELLHPPEGLERKCSSYLWTTP